MSSVIFLFSGQGAQYYQMGAGLYANDSVYRSAFERCSAFAGAVRGRSLVDSVFGQPMENSDGYDDLEETSLALLAQGYATAQSLLARGIRPDALVGYSLGEMTAAVIAGVLGLEQAIKLIRAQARHIERQAPPAAMLAILGSPALMLENPALSRLSEMACINSPQHFVVTTQLANLDTLTKELNLLNVNWARLPVRYGFHGSLLDSAESGYAEHAGHIEFREPAWPVYSSLLAARVQHFDGRHFWQVARGVLRFRDLIFNLWAAEPRIFVDCSPTGTLASFVRQILGNSTSALPAMNRFGRNLDTMAQIELALKQEARL